MDIEKNIEEFSNAERERVKSLYAGNGNATAEQVGEEKPNRVAGDLYAEKATARFEEAKKTRPNGSSPIVMTAVQEVIDGDGGQSLARAFKRAKKDIDYLIDRGERDRIGMRREQYMEEDFLPALEIVINSTSPDEVLNSDMALKALDKYASLLGSGDGYTATYIRNAYGNTLGQKEGRSDDYITSSVRRLNHLLDHGNIRTAYGLANNMKRMIDAGEKQASNQDYELVSRIIAYYE